MSSTCHAVTRELSFTGLGNLPSLTPAHQVDLPIGKGPSGRTICLSLTSPCSGNPSFFATTQPHTTLHGSGLADLISA